MKDISYWKKKLIIKKLIFLLAEPAELPGFSLSRVCWYAELLRLTHSYLLELMVPQLLVLQPIWLPSSWHPRWLRFCGDLLWFSPKQFFIFHSLNSWHILFYFFTTKGFSFMPSTWKVLLLEWGISDWLKYLQFLLHCGTPVLEEGYASSLRPQSLRKGMLGLSGLLAGIWYHSVWNQGAESTMLSAWVLTGLQLQSKHDFYREMTPLYSIYVWPISILIAG